MLPPRGRSWAATDFALDAAVAEAAGDEHAG